MQLLITRSQSKLTQTIKKTYYNRAIAKRNLEDYQGAISDYTMAIEIDPQFALAYNNRGFAKGAGIQDSNSACSDFKEAASLGYKPRIKWLNSQEDTWCRNSY